jgi:hypothetical protein
MKLFSTTGFGHSALIKFDFNPTLNYQAIVTKWSNFRILVFHNAPQTILERLIEKTHQVQDEHG